MRGDSINARAGLRPGAGMDRGTKDTAAGAPTAATPDDAAGVPQQDRRQDPALPPSASDDGAAVAPSVPGSPLIVGVGASAGGLDAITALLQRLPADAGIALVFVQHLSPRHESALPHLLGGATAMPVETATDGRAVQPDHVYVIPPGFEITLAHGLLRLTPRSTDHGVFLPVDRLFRSLADDAGAHAVGVVLSGTGSDGAEGLRAILQAGRQS